MTEARRHPVDVLLGGYLLLAGTALLFPHRGDGWPVLLAVHLALGGALLAGLGPLRRRATGVAGHLVAWYPLLLMPFLYWELPHLIQAVHGPGVFFDARVLAWEEALFGGQPSATLAARADSRALSELLHGAYLAYYPVIYALPAALYLRGRTAAFRSALFALMLGFVACYAIFILFPVQGPRYLFPAPGGAAADAVLFGVAHGVLEAGSSQGAAFPSAHMALAVVQTANARRHLPGWTVPLGLAAVGIAVGAVYGGFHYAVDILAGLAVGLAVAWGAPAVRR